MGSGLVVVLDPLSHHSLQVTVPNDQHPVQTLSASGADLSLDMRVRSRGRDRGLDYPHALGAKHSVSRAGQLGIVVMNHNANGRSLHLPDQVPALLRYPSCVRSIGYANKTIRLVASSIYKRT